MSVKTIGSDKVYSISYGAMGFSHGYGKTPPASEATRLIRLAISMMPAGVKLHIDTAEAYGHGANEELIGEIIAPVRSQVSLATKLFVTSPDNLEEQIRDHLRQSLERLKETYVEVYYLHRLPPNIPVEEVARVMGKLIAEKSIGGWGLSQVDADDIKKAHAITPLTAIQSEYSMMERMYEKEVIPTCEALGIAFLAFSPMASGFLSADPNYTKSAASFEGDDVRRVITRYSAENVASNQPLLDMLKQIAAEKSTDKSAPVTPAQISLAWMINKYPSVIALPGMRTEPRVRENLGAGDIVLSAEEVAALDTKLDNITVHGNRTDKDIMRLNSVPVVDTQGTK